MFASEKSSNNGCKNSSVCTTGSHHLGLLEVGKRDYESISISESQDIVSPLFKKLRLDSKQK